MEISGYLVLVFFILPLILWVTVWGLFAIAYPFMFLYGALTSSASRKRWKDDILRREKDTLHKVGRDLLSMDKIRIPFGSSNPEVIWASIVIGPSHWQQLLGLLYNLIGGSVDIYRDLLAIGRSEVLQRLREVADSKGFDNVVGVRLDTSMIGTQRPKGGGSKGIEIFAYGTGVRNAVPTSFTVQKPE
ncbi:MAG: heavy metal-binding domain-containing protein [Candidatus Thermoplasmatota archaeon]|nr:heavy metal-binding domain-containing protein [Candidatus Thermoplasmatota archaeon]MEC8045817.1 heavy metal-binding domain-containing protein [Candidatus Thermoplasmatota archaeon]MEC9137424.1 heavy metal-binding domain-containing protein [Candidatus Thermoplasmatota archaeon]MED5303086.1 heavy metal-binding domain-containing protein [Candidatus Thermoplasmatota archaeon]|tara:strand:+ start:2663 stop:3226 length:564 start_codon:yes stop_codon:yes gene_type:complete